MHISNFKHASQSSKAVCCTTQSRRQVQPQQIQKGIMKTTKSVTIQPFSASSVHGFTMMKGQGMRLNLIAKRFADS